MPSETESERNRLLDLSRVLDVPIGFFFSEMREEVAGSSPGQIKGNTELPRSAYGPSLQDLSVFADIIRPIDAARELKELFGEEAWSAAISCACAAAEDCREKDRDFWLEVAAILRSWTGNA